jgi:hypothetical protein
VQTIVGSLAPADAATTVETTLLTHLVGRAFYPALLAAETWVWLATQLAPVVALGQAVRLGRVVSADRVHSDTCERAAAVVTALLTQCTPAGRTAFAKHFPWSGQTHATAELWGRLDLKRCVAPTDLAECYAVLKARGEAEWRRWLQASDGDDSSSNLVASIRLLATAMPHATAADLIKHLRWTFTNKRLHPVEAAGFLQLAAKALVGAPRAEQAGLLGDVVGYLSRAPETAHLADVWSVLLPSCVAAGIGTKAAGLYDGVGGEGWVPRTVALGSFHSFMSTATSELASVVVPAAPRSFVAGYREYIAVSPDAGQRTHAVQLAALVSLDLQRADLSRKRKAPTPTADEHAAVLGTSRPKRSRSGSDADVAAAAEDVRAAIARLASLTAGQRPPPAIVSILSAAADRLASVLL